MPISKYTSNQGPSWGPKLLKAYEDSWTNHEEEETHFHDFTLRREQLRLADGVRYGRQRRGQHLFILFIKVVNFLELFKVPASKYPKVAVEKSSGVHYI